MKKSTKKKTTLKAKKPTVKAQAPKKKKTTKAPVKKQTTKPYVQYSTIWKGVGGGFSNPGETKICKVGAHKVLVKRGNTLDKNGNPRHTVTYINKDGSLGQSYTGTGSATLIASKALAKSGVETKHKSNFPKKKRSKNAKK